MGLADTARLAVQLDLSGNFQAKLRASQQALGHFDSQISRTQTRAYRAGQQIGTGIKNIARLGVGVAITGAGVIAASLKVAGDFEAQLNTINTIARETPAGLSKIGDSIRKIARDTGTSLDDLTQGYYDLLSAGVKAADATNVLTAANKLAIGGLSTTAESIDLLTTAVNTYGGDASKAAEDADIFAKAIERGKVTAAQLAETFATVGPIAAASGISIKELAAGYAQLTATGVPAAEAATEIRSAIVALTRRSTNLKDLEKATHKSYLAIAGKQGLVEAMQQLRTDAAKAGVPLIDVLGRVEGLNFVLATTGPNFKSYNDNLDAMGHAAGTAAGQMAERQKGLNFELSRLKALAKDAGITIGSALLPKLTPLVEKLAAFVDSKQGDIAKFGQTIAGLFSDKNIAEGGKVLTGIFQTAKDLLPAIQGAAQITGQAIKVAVDTFKSLPPDLQKLAIAALAVNKLTGGLVTNIAGGLIGTVVSKLFSALKSAVVNVQGGVVNVGGATGGIGAAAGKTSTAGKIASIATRVFLVGAAVGAFAELAGILSDQEAANRQQGKDLVGQAATFGNSSAAGDIQKSLNGINTYTHELWKGLTPEAIAYQLNIGGVRDSIDATKAELNKSLVATVMAESKTTTAVEKVRGAVGFAGDQSTNAAEKVRNAQLTSAEKIRSAAAATGTKIDTARRAIAAAQRATTQAVKNKESLTKVNIALTTNTRVNVADVVRAQTTFSHVGNVYSTQS